MAQNTSDSRQQATDLLDELTAFLTSIHNKQFQIHTLSLQALHLDTQGENSAALDTLKKALNMAEPSGFIRLFVDMGPRMFGLLNQLTEQNVALGYIGQILTAFRGDKQAFVPLSADQQTASSHQPGRPSGLSQPLVGSLTNRELDVLELLTLRLSNKEIADRLFISPKTVKKHLDNIYGKLNISSRRQAVERAVVLGVLSSGYPENFMKVSVW